MYYYEVWVASQRFHGNAPLTYAHTEVLPVGTLVVAQLQRQLVMGVTVKTVSKPVFKTKEITRVLGNSSLPAELMELIKWLRAYYPSSIGGLLQAFLPSTLLQTSRPSTKPARDGLDPDSIKLPTLTKEQQVAVKIITETPESSVLLHGETGSGKTRVYLELARSVLNSKRSCIVLTPEIGLTPQLAQTFVETFGDKVIVLHSMLTATQRRNAWLKVLEATTPLIVVGTRSALFAPIKKVGLIIMDEAHDHAYKQESAPCYQTTRVAARLAALHKATLVMGTATPLVADYYTLAEKGAPIVRMKELAIASTKPPDITVVRIEDRDEFVRSRYISEQLLKQITKALDKKEQVLIFLNRRGTARVVMCQQCGWQAACPNCDVALTYHGDSHHIRCHICGHKASTPPACPSCHNTDISFRGVGTKYLVDELSRLFSGARVQRFDTDSTKAERLEQHYDNVRDGGVDILVGTQLLSKGLDLPKLSVIGVVIADTSLLIPDFTANELAYQQLTQIMGRVGRGHRHGSIVIQSYNPENPAIQAAINRDYQAFYEQEIKERRQFGFPPFYFLLKLECARATSASAERASSALATELREKHSGIEVVGPSPSFHEKSAGKYKWQLVVKSKQRQALTAIIKDIPSGWSYDIDPANLL